MKHTKLPKNQNDAPLTDQSVTEGTDKLLRTQAELDNLRKRFSQEKETLLQYATASLITDLLPVLDNFKRAALHVPTTEDQTTKNWIIGIQAVERQFEEILRQAGVSEIEAKPGQPFDPMLHEAIAHEPSDEPVDTISQVTETGYTLHTKVLRPTKVKVSSGN